MNSKFIERYREMPIRPGPGMTDAIVCGPIEISCSVGVWFSFNYGTLAAKRVPNNTGNLIYRDIMRSHKQHMPTMSGVVPCALLPRTHAHTHTHCTQGRAHV